MTSGMFSERSAPWFGSGYMLGVSLRGLLSSTLQKNCGVSAVAVPLMVVDIPFVMQRPIHMVQAFGP